MDDEFSEFMVAVGTMLYYDGFVVDTDVKRKVQNTLKIHGFWFESEEEVVAARDWLDSAG